MYVVILKNKDILWKFSQSFYQVHYLCIMYLCNFCRISVLDHTLRIEAEVGHRPAMTNLRM